MFPNGIKHYFETELLDYALTIGMTEDEYWFGDPRLMDNFEKKFEAHRKMEAHNAWLTGVYVKAAINSSVFACGFYDKKKSGALPQYPDFDFGDKESKKMTESDIAAEREKAYLFFKNLQVQNSKKKRG